MLSELFASLQGNPYFAAGFGLAGMGISMSILRKATVYSNVFFKKYCFATLEIPSRDKSYEWVIMWLARRRLMSNQHHTVSTVFSQQDTGKIVTEFHFPPSVGEHYFWYRNKIVKVERTKHERLLDMSRQGAPYEVLQFTHLSMGGDKTANIYEEMLNEAKSLALSQNEGQTATYICSGMEWTQFGYSKKRRPLDSVVLKDDLGEKLKKDVLEFIRSSQWYHQRGIPYRRGYLLHGPPGCGKTSLITALAGEIYYNICVLNLAERGLSDDRLNYLLNTAPQQSVIVLEDVDSCFLDKADAYSVSRSGLLNALDGVASSEERIIFMTTNHIEKIVDPAFVRPGRIDVVCRVGGIEDEQQLRRMFGIFYKNDHDAETVERLSGEFAGEVIKLGLGALSPAQVQSYLLMYKNAPESAVKDVPSKMRSIH